MIENIFPDVRPVARFRAALHCSLVLAQSVAIDPHGHQLDPNRALHNILTQLWALGMLPSCPLVVTRCNSIN
jgi:hypothetical protein